MREIIEIEAINEHPKGKTTARPEPTREVDRGHGNGQPTHPGGNPRGVIGTADAEGNHQYIRLYGSDWQQGWEDWRKASAGDNAAGTAQGGGVQSRECAVEQGKKKKFVIASNVPALLRCHYARCSGPFPPHEFYFADSIHCLDMTAIVEVHCHPDGFVIGADGRRATSDGIFVSDTAQKIFPIPCIGGAHAWAGATELLFGRTRFSFPEQFDQFTRIYGRSAASLESHVTNAGEFIYGELCKFTSGDMRDVTDTGHFREVLAKGIFLGYQDGKPERFIYQYPNMNGKLGHELLVGGAPDRCLNSFSGLPPHVEHRPSTMTDCSNEILGHLKRCADLDSAYGGWAHVATVTPDKFEWLIPPKRN